jgi:hypothetical protein
MGNLMRNEEAWRLAAAVTAIALMAVFRFVFH